MKNLKKKISLILWAGVIMSCAASVHTVGIAAEELEERVIQFGQVYSFDKFTLSYKDAQTASLQIAFSEDGTNYGDYQTVDFSNTVDGIKYLSDTVTAKCAKLKVGKEGLPKINLEQITRYNAAKDTVGAGTRGIDGNTKAMWNAGADAFAQFFDGTYNDDGSIANLGKCTNTGLYHDAIKDGRTTDKSLAMVELPFLFNEPLELAYAMVYMSDSNAADFYVRTPDKNAANRRDVTKENDFGQSQTIPSESGDKKVYVIKAPLCDEGEKTASVDLYWHNFHNYRSQNGVENAYVDMPEIAFYYYNDVLETGYVLHDGASYTFDAPKSFARIVGEIPDDMWYVGIKADGTEVDFQKKDGSTGYFADKLEEIKSLTIRGYNQKNVSSTKIPKTINLYGEITDLARAAYTKDKSSVTVSGKAEASDFGDDPRKEYMSIDKETGVDALFDGDERYNSYTPYHMFVSSDPARLTLTSDSSVTVDLGVEAIIDTVSYYAGPQYTPKKYDVYIGKSKDVSGTPIISKTYELLEGRLSPFINDYGPYYCAMHEDQNVTDAYGQYVTVVNDGVLKPETDHLQITDHNGNLAVDTVMRNEALMNKNVILAKELRVMGAPLVESINTESIGGFTVECKYNDDNTVKAGSNKVTITVNNNTDEAENGITVYVAVYDGKGILKSVHMSESFDAKADPANIKIENVNVEQGYTVRPFVWNAEQEPLATIDGIEVN